MRFSARCCRRASWRWEAYPILKDSPANAHNMSTLARMNGSRGDRMAPLFTRVNVASMAAFLKIAACISAIGTGVLAGVILGWQVISWFLTNEWDQFPISRALSLAHLERPAIYVTASASDRPPPSLDFQMIYDWFLNLPAGGFLLAVAAVLL